MFTPEAYITAIKQCVAQSKNWSLEELVLNVIIHDKLSDGTDLGDSSFGLVECKLQGAVAKSNVIHLDDENIYTDCKLIELKWSRELENTRENRVTLPVYLNSQRTELLLRLDIGIGEEVLKDENAFYEKGVAFLASTIGF